MGQLQNDLKIVLQLEREGEAQLRQAEEEARQLLEKYRDQVERLVFETDQKLERQRRDRMAEVEDTMLQRKQTLDGQFETRVERLRLRAVENRDKTVERIITWLFGEA